MKVRYIQRKPTSTESGTAVAAAVTAAVGVGAAVFWLTRTLLARDRVTPVALVERGDEAPE